MKLYPVIHPLAKDIRISQFLKGKGLNLFSIPKDGETVTLRNRISLASSGVVEALDKKTIHPRNLQLFRKTPALFKANILGIDAIFDKGIEFPHDEQTTIFREVNLRPYLKMHDYPR